MIHPYQECIARKDVQLEYMKSHDQAVDIFTKPLKQEDFTKLRSLIRVTKSSLKGVLKLKLDFGF